MKIGPFEIEHGLTTKDGPSQTPLGIGRLMTKALPPLAPLSSRGTWWPLVGEPYEGAWQSNVTVALEDVISHPTAWACITLIAADIAKNAVCLVEPEPDEDGVWSEVERNSPFWPVLRKPNSYQTRIEFFENWMISKLTRGNTYVLKERDQRGMVKAMHVLDPARVTVLVAPDSSVFYQLKRDDLSGLPKDEDIVPASRIIHDRGPTLYHPLIGVSPIFASGMAAYQALKIQYSQTLLFKKGAHPGGVIQVPGEITQATADRLKAQVDKYSGEGDNVGAVLVLGSGMEFKQSGLTAVDTELIKQLGWSDEKICSTFHVPGFMVGVGPQPPYNNIQAIWQLYYQQCLQIHFEEIELLLDEGLGMVANNMGTSFDIDNLMRMDSQTQMATLKEGVGAGILKPNEARNRLNRKKVDGGDTPYLQEQNWPLKQLASRDIAAVKPAPEPPAPMGADPKPDEDDDELTVNFASALHRKAVAEGLYAA